MALQSKNLNYAFNKEYYDFLFGEKTYKELEEDKNLQRQLEANTTTLIKKSEDYIDDYRGKWFFSEDIAQATQSFELEVQYPGLIVGIGNPHGTALKGDIKIGMNLDYISGLPWISGSSLKGRLRSIFQERCEDKRNDDGKNQEGIQILSIKNYLTSIKNKNDENSPLSEKDFSKEAVKELMNYIFEGCQISSNDSNGQKSQQLPMSERDIFYGGVVVPENNVSFLKEDSITPHKEIYQNPIPIKLLDIAPKTKIKFFFSLKDSSLSNGITISAEDKLELFKSILMDFGIGAKTNVGYGILEER